MENDPNATISSKPERTLRDKPGKQQRKGELPLVKELRDQAARLTLRADNPFEARTRRTEWRAADEIERLHGPFEAWMVLKQWLASYVWEEGAFGKYADHVSLDGVMTAGEARALAKLFNVKAEAPGAARRAAPSEIPAQVSDGDERIGVER